MKTERNLINKLKKSAAQAKWLAILWTGNDGWILSDGELVLAFDLDFYLSERLATAPVTTAELGPELNLLLITHEHDDHFNAATVSELVQTSDCCFMLPLSCQQKANQIGIPESRRLMIRPGQKQNHLGMEFSAVRALHGHLYQSVYKGASLDDCGYAFTFGGRKIYQPGDTILLQEHLEMPPVDVLFVSPTEHNTHIKPSCRMISAINPKWIVAQHFGTYQSNAANTFWTQGYPDELRSMLGDEYRSHFIIPKPGEIYLIDASYC